MSTNIINIANTLTNIINMPAEATNSVLRVAEMPPKTWWEIALMIGGPALTALSAWLMWRSVEEMRRQTQVNQETARNDKIFQLRYNHIKSAINRVNYEPIAWKQELATLAPDVLQTEMQKISHVLASIVAMHTELVGLIEDEKLKKTMTGDLLLLRDTYIIISSPSLRSLNLEEGDTKIQASTFFVSQVLLFRALCSDWDKYFLGISMSIFDNSIHEIYKANLESQIQEFNKLKKDTPQ